MKGGVGRQISYLGNRAVHVGVAYQSRQSHVASLARVQLAQTRTTKFNAHPNNNISTAAHRQYPRCVHTTIHSAVRESTLERCVFFFFFFKSRRSVFALIEEDSRSRTIPTFRRYLNDIYIYMYMFEMPSANLV